MEAIVDTDVFKSHSVRGASTSVALSDILSTADLNKESLRSFITVPPKRIPFPAEYILSGS